MIAGYLRNGRIEDAAGNPIGDAVTINVGTGYGHLARTRVHVWVDGVRFYGSCADNAVWLELRPVSFKPFESPLLNEYAGRIK